MFAFQVPITVNNTDFGRAVRLLSDSKCLTEFRLLFSKSSVAKSSAVAVISDIVRQEMVNFCKMQTRNTNNLNSLLNFKWTSFLNVANRISPSIVQ